MKLGEMDISGYNHNTLYEFQSVLPEYSHSEMGESPLHQLNIQTVKIKDLIQPPFRGPIGRNMQQESDPTKQDLSLFSQGLLCCQLLAFTLE